MKRLLTGLVAMMSLNAFSQVIYMDAASVDLGGSAATLVKTTATPSSVNLGLIVPTQVERCNPQDFVTATDGNRCGYDEVPRMCGGGYGYPGRVGTPGRVGPRYNPPVGPGRVGPRPGPGSIPAGTRYNPNHDNRGGYYGPTYCGYDRVPRTCSFCLNPYYVTVDMNKTFKLTFEKFTQDATIDFAIDQYGTLVLDVKGVSPSCVVKTVYGSGSNITGAKLKLKRSCR